MPADVPSTRPRCAARSAPAAPTVRTHRARSDTPAAPRVRVQVRSAAPPGDPVLPHQGLRALLRGVYERAQHSTSVLGSAVAIVGRPSGDLPLPRFARPSLATVEKRSRVAIFAGFAPGDVNPCRAVLGLVDRLVDQPRRCAEVDLLFYPVVNVRCLLAGEPGRNLLRAAWRNTTEPEIAALSREALMVEHDALVTVVTTRDEEPSVTLRAPWTPQTVVRSLALLAAARFCTWPVQVERLTPTDPYRGPLELGFSRPPTEVEIALPSCWKGERADREFSGLLPGLLAAHSPLFGALCRP